MISGVIDGFDYRTSGLKVLEEEIGALQKIRPYVDSPEFASACEAVARTEGKVIVTGMGKSGHIASKIAATLASTGTPAFFVHPGEAAHGDLGMVSESDLVIAISNSGESSEIATIIPVLKRIGVKLICVTGNPDSTMGKAADIHLCIHVEQEACPLNLAPTSSTTTTLVMGDALAVAVLEAKGFTAEDFAMSHPGGALGRKLLLRNRKIMHTGERLPKVGLNATLRDVVLEMTKKGLGMTAIVRDDGTVWGVFTDGDLRRAFEKGADGFSLITEFAREGCVTAGADMLAAKSLEIMQAKKINGMLVTDAFGKLVGAFNVYDLMSSGVL